MNLFALPAASLPLRDYQFDNVVQLVELIDWERRIVDHLPTRAGKTRIAIEIIKRYLVLGKRVIFVTPRLSLIEQTSRAFEREGVSQFGVIQGNHYRTDASAPVQIASAQTLARRDIPDADLVIIDECHLQFKVIQKWMEDPEWRDVPFIGLSATPWARGMGKYWRKLVSPVTILELTDLGVLTPFRILAPPPPDLRGVEIVNGDFRETQLAARCDQPEIVGNVIETWLKHARDRKTLVYGVNCAHAQHLQERFVEAGITCEYCDGDTPLFEREDIFRRLETGSTQIISSVRTLDTGLDLPCVSCIVDARPTKSRMLYVQAWGRGITANHGKADCLFLDHAGNVRRLGLITEIGSTILDDGEGQRSAERQPDKGEAHDLKLCPECHCVQAPKARECPQCGHVFHAVSLVRETAGELIELGSKVSGLVRPGEPDKRLWHGALIWLYREAQARGKIYKPTWPAANFKEKFGHYPPWSWGNEPIEPTVEIRNWVRSRQIAFAKARRTYG